MREGARKRERERKREFITLKTLVEGITIGHYSGRGTGRKEW